MTNNFIFLLIYSVALACISFFLGAAWQDRRLLNLLTPPPLPDQQKMEPPPVMQPSTATSPFAPKPKQTPPSSSKVRYQRHIVEALNKARAEKAANSPPPQSSHPLPDIPWGTQK